MLTRTNFRATTCLWAVAAAALLILSGCDLFMSVDQRIARAEQKAEVGDERGAIIDLQNALKSAPDNVKARLLLAQLSLRLGDPKAAAKELARAEQSGAKPADIAVVTAETRLALGEQNDLLAELDAGKLPMPESQRQTYRGLALLAKADLGQAVSALSAAIDLDSNFSRARVARAQAYAQLGRTEDALDDLESVLQLDAKNANAWLLRGSLLARAGQYKQSLEAFGLARQSAPGRLTPVELNTAFAGATECQLALGDLASAHQTQAELSARAPDAPLTLFLAARIAMAEHKYSEAIAATQKALAGAPEFVQAKLLLGTALLANGSANQATLVLADVVQKDPSNIEARKLLAQVYLRLQRPDLALQLLGSLPTDSQDAQLDALRGWASLQQGNQEQAISLLERSLASQPDSVSLKLDLAYAYLASGVNQKAVKLLQGISPQEGGTRRDALLLAAVRAANGTDAGRTEAARLVTARPNDPATLAAAAAFAFQQQDYASARQYLNRAIALDAKDASTVLALARVEAASGDLQSSRKAFEKVLAIDESNQEARLSIARLDLAQGNPADGIRMLEELRKADPRSVEARLVLATVYLQQKRNQDAETVIDEALAAANGNSRILGAIAQLYLEMGRFDAAAARFRDAATQEPTNAVWMLGLARAQIASGNYIAARESAQKAQSIAKNPTPAASLLVALDLREGKIDAAAGRVEELRKTQPNDPGAALLRGDIALNRKDYAGAADAYQQSYKLRPSSAAAIKFYGVSSQGKLPRATTLLEDWLKHQPRDAAARMLFASALTDSGESARAIEQYEQIASDSRPSPIALNNLAWLYFERGDDRAESIAKRAFDAAPENAAIADTYGWILLKNKRIAESLPVLQRAASGAAAAPEVRYHYAAALAEAGQREQALQIVREILASTAAFPAAADARRLLAELEG